MKWAHRLRIRQLEVLLVLYGADSVTAAADQIGISQPALSKWLTEIEREIGSKLFIRSSRGFKPTAACEQFLQHARAVIGEMERAETSLELMSSGSIASLAIGTTPPATASLLPEAVHQFREIHPDVHLTLQEGTMENLLPELKAAKLDFLIVRMDSPISDRALRYEPLYQEEIRVVSGATHPLGKRRKVDWADIAGEDWIGPSRTSQLRPELEHELAMAGQPPPHYKIETSSMLAIVRMLGRGTLLAAMSSRMADYFRDSGQICILPLKYRRHSGIGLLSSRNAQTSIYKTAFLNALRVAANAL